MSRTFIAFLSGLLMSVGITISQMIDPVKVINFLAFFGDPTWDPTLLVVMASALVTYAVLFALFKKRQRPILQSHFHLPNKRDVDRPLVIGASIFGLGWGLVGYCPGPAMAAVLGGSTGTLGFVIAMLVGFLVAGKVPLSRTS